MNMQENLGKYARDKITGFEGTIIGMLEYLFGCKQYCLAPKVKDNEIKDAHWFDIGRVEMIDGGVIAKDVSSDSPGGIAAYAPKAY